MSEIPYQQAHLDFTYTYVESSWLLSLLALDPVSQVLKQYISLVQLCMSLNTVKKSPLILCKNKNNKKYKRQQYSHAKKINGIEIQKKNS